LPHPFGGKVRELMVDVDPKALHALGLSPRDVNQAIFDQSLIIPTGDAKIGTIDYVVNANANPLLPEDYNQIPIKTINGSVVYLRDVGRAHSGFPPQINIVRNMGKRGCLQTIIKNGTTSIPQITDELKAMMPELRAAAPPGMNINLLFDQSVFVDAAIKNVVTEGLLAALLTGLCMLLFLGSWRSTLIVLTSIPLSVLATIILLGMLGYSLDLMTLGGLALSIGILVDNATVTLENVHRHFELGKPLQEAIFDGLEEITIPSFVSTLAICVVFLPVTLLVGASKSLFVPFALSVVFAIGFSFLLSRTLVPVMIAYLLKKEHVADKPKTFLERFYTKFERGFDRFRERYQKMLRSSLKHRSLTCLLFGIIFLSSIFLVPFIGIDFFPRVDANQLRLHVKAPTGTRVEVTEEIFGSVEEAVKRVIPQGEISMMIDNIGVNPLPYNMAYGDNATIGHWDGEILIALNPKKKKKSTFEYMKELRPYLKKRFPDCIFYFQPADLISQILNFGLPTPIDVRIVGRDKNNLQLALELVEKISHVPGAVDVHLHQDVATPELFLNIDRTLLAQLGLTQKDIMNDILISFSDSTVVSRNYWLDRTMGVPYSIAVQAPKYRFNTIEELLNMPISSPFTPRASLLSNLAILERKTTPAVINHVNIQPAYDVFANIEGLSLGKVAGPIQKILDEYKLKLAPGNKLQLRGMVSDMNLAYTKLGIGFLCAIILIYFILVINFQSWLDPFIIVMALLGAISGILWLLYLTHTSFSVPSLMGAIVAMGVATANSILVVTFANEQLLEGKSSEEASHMAGVIRLRPVVMTALAMVLGMLPMALGIGEGAEQNAPLGRAVIGGLIVATVTTLFFVPTVFSIFRKKPNIYLVKENQHT
jgi:multidrug efflux pump subunit AcrB